MRPVRDSTRLRQLTASDLEAVTEIENAVSSHPWSMELFAGELDLHRAQRHWLVAVDDLGSASSPVVGFGGMMYVAEDAHLMNLAVAPHRVREGIGRRLVNALFLEAIDRGSKNLTLEVRVSNLAARALYSGYRLGPVGIRPGYYPDGEDALILWAHDIDHPDYRELVVGGVDD